LFFISFQVKVTKFTHYFFNMRSILIFAISFLAVLQINAQNEDSVLIRKIYDFSLTESVCYDDLRVLCKEVGHRLSGSKGAEKAVIWGEKTLKSYGLDTVYLQEVMVTHWERGSKENLTITNKTAKKAPIPIKIATLGGSVGTNGVLKGEIIEVFSLKELEKLGRKAIEGKIVFFNRPMDPKLIDTFNAYGGCVDQRGSGATEAAKYGAKAVLVRSMTLALDNFPHTGGTWYEDSITKIPAAAISTISAITLHDMLKKGDKLEASLELDCKLNPDVKSYNVIAEIKGTENPGKIITVGGHLDSWDIGEGAHDDGAGIVHSMQVMHTFKNLGIKPKNTIRCVLFMNEENGNKGGKHYAKVAKDKKEVHLAALESDRGGFAPRGFSVDGTDQQLLKLQSWKELLKPYQLHIIEKGYGGVDIGPLKDGKICLIGFVPDSQRYFDHHHAATDVFETVNKRELQLGASAITSFIYLIDKYGVE
jgi:carboxypeptidase Q